MIGDPRHKLGYGSVFGRILKKLKCRDRALFEELERGVGKILTEPTLGKPLGNVPRGYRRIHVKGSFVLLYEIHGNVVRLLDFDHHGRIYKKYS